MHFTHSSSHSFPHPRNLPAARDAFFFFPPLFSTLPRPPSPLSCAVLPPLPHFLLPVGGVLISSGNREPPPPINYGGYFPPSSNWGRASVFPQGGCWPNFSKRSPGGASRPSVILLSGLSLSVGSGGVVILPPPISKRSLRGG
jgi:hypothetical protein